MRSHCDKALILRTNFFCWGPSYRPSFSDRILASALNSEIIYLPIDVYITPLLASRLCTAAMTLITNDHFGTFNLSSNNKVSKYVFGIALLEVFNLPTQFPRKTCYEDYKTSTARPKDMSLSNKKVLPLIGDSLGCVKDQISGLAKEQYADVDFKFFHDLPIQS